jgi:hypothetical protein
VPTPQAEAGWLLHADDTEGFSVALPDSWEHYKADRASLLNGFGSIRQQHPLLASIYSDQRCECLHKAGWRLFAFDTAAESRDDDYPATLILYKFGGLDDPQLEDTVFLRIEQLMATDGVVQPVASDLVESNAGAGARLWYLSNHYLDDATNLPLYSVEYLVAKGGDLYYLVFTTSLDGQPHYAPLLDKILRSFKAIETGNLEGTV